MVGLRHLCKRLQEFCRCNLGYYSQWRRDVRSHQYLSKYVTSSCPNYINLSFNVHHISSYHITWVWYHIIWVSYNITTYHIILDIIVGIISYHFISWYMSCWLPLLNPEETTIISPLLLYVYLPLSLSLWLSFIMAYVYTYIHLYITTYLFSYLFIYVFLLVTNMHDTAYPKYTTIWTVSYLSLSILIKQYYRNAKKNTHLYIYI